MVRRLLCAACLLTGFTLAAKVWFDSLQYNGWPSYEAGRRIWHNLGSTEDVMMLTALVLALGFISIGLLLLLNRSSIGPLAAVALFAVAAWHQWGQDVRIPSGGLWAIQGFAPALRLNALLGPTEKSPWIGDPYQRGTRTILYLLIPLGLALSVAETIRQSRDKRSLERTAANPPRG